MINDHKIMLLTNSLQSASAGGRELLCKLNYDALRDIYQERLVLFELLRQPVRGLKAFFNAFRGHIDGLDEATMSTALETIKNNNVEKVFVDGSNLGVFVEVAKKKFPNLEIVSFFHNVEARFFLGSLRQTKSVKSLGVLLANYLAERKAVLFSDKIICLNERDSRLLKKLYGRGATHVSPMALKDKLPSDHYLMTTPPKEKYALFVGGTFYANRQGIEWFVEYVAAKSPIKIYVVGKGFEEFKVRLERNGNVEVVGSVDSLVPWYLSAHVVIAPIFDGSGMKTKVAEGLMFGKRVIGTDEAFVGYEAVLDHVGAVCASPDQFLAALRVEAARPFTGADLELRSYYEAHYSYRAAREQLARILAI